MTWAQRFRLRGYLRTSLWIVPAVCIAGAIALAEVMDEVDRDLLDDRLDADTARVTLAAIASGMIAFTGFVFSTAVLVVQFGSTAFSPRLIRVLRQDRAVKYALAAFTATFVYALWVLSEVTSERVRSVPIASWSVAVLLLLVSMGAFLVLIQRLVNGLRIARVASDIAVDSRAVIDELSPPGDDEPERLGGMPAEHDQVVRHRGGPAVVVAIDRRGLVRMARRASGTIALVPQVGDFVAEGQPLFLVRGRRIDERRLRRAVVFGDERTLEQDPRFGLRLLVDIAIRALSPGINDPTTAVQILDRLDFLLHHLATRRLGTGCLADRSGQVRLVFATPVWEDYLELALTEIRQYGAGSVQVVRRLRALLEDLREVVPEARRAAVEQQLQRLDAGVASDDPALAARADRQGLGAGRVVR